MVPCETLASDEKSNGGLASLLCVSVATGIPWLPAHSPSSASTHDPYCLEIGSVHTRMRTCREARRTGSLGRSGQSSAGAWIQPGPPKTAHTRSTYPPLMQQHQHCRAKERCASFARLRFSVRTWIPRLRWLRPGFLLLYRCSTFPTADCPMFGSWRCPRPRRRCSCIRI